MVEVESIFLTTTIIQRLKNNNRIGTATGFFYTKENRIFLVTNKHVIYGNEFALKESLPEVSQLEIMLHSNRNNLTQNEKVIINLFEGEKKLWLEHLQSDVDVICIPINLDRQKYFYVTVADNLINSDNIKIGFEKIFVMGYPLGWYDSVFNLPITRIGHLSSPFGIPFRGRPFLLGDVETHKGMSGSPVFMYLKDYETKNQSGTSTINLGSRKFILLGIYSGQPNWPVQDIITNDIRNVPHSLSIVWFSSLIREIVNIQK